MRRVFLIGHGGVGKSTCGPLFAASVGYAFVDLDTEFMRRIGNITAHIEEQGYVEYCRANSRLFYALLEEQQTDTVYALSSGFLVHGEVDPDLAKHQEAIKLGVSILLLPAADLAAAEPIIVARQLARNLYTSEASQRRTIRERHPRYLAFGDIQIFSAAPPATIAGLMQAAYLEFLARAS